MDERPCGKLSGYCYGDPDLRVLCYLARYPQPIYPRFDLIAANCGIPKMRVRSVLKHLEEKGFIKVEKMGDGFGHRITVLSGFGREGERDA